MVFMINKYLMAFQRSNIVDNADLAEKIGCKCLGLLRIGFGKTVTLEKISADKDQIQFSVNRYSIAAKVSAVALAILLFPLTALLAGIGCIAVSLSKSHQETYHAYIQFDLLKPNLEIKNDKQPEDNKIIPTIENPLNKNEKVDETLTDDNKIITIEKPSTELDDLQITDVGIEPQTRKTPPLSLCDTIIGTGSGIFSAHGVGTLFTDDEIIEKLNVVKKVEFGPDAFIYYTKNGKAIIQQQATRGCTAAAAAMLIMDHGKTPNFDELSRRNLGNDDDQIRDLKEAGLSPITPEAKDLSELRDLIELNGSCIATVVGKLGGHVIVVDFVSEDLSKIRLRDPCHGWEITVGSEAFLKEWCGGTIIQVEKSSIKKTIINDII